MHVRPRDLRAGLRNLRGLGALVLVLSLLIFANAAALADSAESAFRAAIFGPDVDLASALAAHQADLMRYAAVEYGSLILALAGALLAAAGPALQRAVRR
jgi:hypothetical protein